MSLYSIPPILRRPKKRKPASVKTIYSVPELAEMSGHTPDYVRALLKRCGVLLDKGKAKSHKVYLHMLVIRAKPFWDACVVREKMRLQMYGPEGEPEVDDEDEEPERD